MQALGGLRKTPAVRDSQEVLEVAKLHSAIITFNAELHQPLSLAVIISRPVPSTMSNLEVGMSIAKFPTEVDEHRLTLARTRWSSASDDDRFVVENPATGQPVTVVQGAGPVE